MFDFKLFAGFLVLSVLIAADPAIGARAGHEPPAAERSSPARKPPLWVYENRDCAPPPNPGDTC